MLSEKDKSVVYSMCQVGMSLETLKVSFPQFDFNDIKDVFAKYQNERIEDFDSIPISCNCS